MGDAEQERPGGKPASGLKGFWATLTAVLWSFFGVRRSDHHDEDMRNLNPIHVIIVGILAAFVFVMTLIGIVKLVVP